MGNALDVAAAAVGTALALSSQGVHINSVNPFSISPTDAFQQPFSKFRTVLRVFQQHLVANLPDQLAGGVQALAFDDTTVIQTVVDAVEALILA